MHLSTSFQTKFFFSKNQKAILILHYIERRRYQVFNSRETVTLNTCSAAYNVCKFIHLYNNTYVNIYYFEDAYINFRCLQK